MGSILLFFSLVRKVLVWLLLSSVDQVSVLAAAVFTTTLVDCWSPQWLAAALRRHKSIDVLQVKFVV